MVTFQITPNPLSPSHIDAYGVMSNGENYTIKANGGTASSDAFYNAIRTAYPTNATHPVYSNLTVIGHRETRVDSPNTLYSYVVEYAQTDSGGVPGDVVNQLQLITLPPRVESIQWDFYQQPSWVDAFDNPKINSAGDSFDPPRSVEKSRGIVTISCWQSGYAADTWKPFGGKLNDAPVVIPGLGLCDTRTARVLSIRPASGFSPYLTITATITGTATHGDPLSWTGGFTGYYGALAGTGNQFTVINATGSVAVGDAFTDENTSSSFAATATVAATSLPLKLFFVIEWRETGFDYLDIDQGSRGWWKNGTQSAAISQIFIQGSLAGATVNLRGGVPSSFASNPSDNTYTSLNSGGNWDVSTTNDYLLARVLSGEVFRTQNGLTDLILFQDDSSISFHGLPF